MRAPVTLSFYIGRHFMVGLFMALFGLLLVTHMIDLVELVRRGASKPGITFAILWQMSVLRVPKLMEDLLPYAMLIGGMVAMIRLTKTQELVVARAAGISVWQFLSPCIAIAMLVGVVFVTLFHPLSASMLSRFDQMESRYLKGKPSLLTLSSSGLWLRQPPDSEINLQEEHIIRASSITQKDMTLRDVILFTFGSDSSFVSRVDAEEARLGDHEWILARATLSKPSEKPIYYPEYRIPTTFSIEEIQNSFAAPRTLSFWQLPGFIRMLEKAGFSAVRHRIYFHSIMSEPLLLAGMVLVAGVFSLRLPRRGRIGLMVTGGIMAGFVVRMMTDIVHALGESGNLPVPFAAWTPAVVTVIFGVALLLHMEDG